MGCEGRCQREAGTIGVRFPRTFLMASGAISTSLCNSFFGDSTFMEGRMSGRRRYTVWSEPTEPPPTPSLFSIYLEETKTSNNQLPRSQHG